MLLSPGDFAAFFAEVWGHAPFPWQARLARLAADQGRMPDLMDLPTGSGKTACLDIGLFLLALDPSRFARRIVLVVDRRTIVDQSHRRALALQGALAQAEADPASRPVSARVAASLRALSGPRTRETEPVLDAVVLRGGIPQDRDWARTPSRPLLVASTVDQVGSRLLFRGYGLSDSMAPVHAGLLGTDTLLLLDEVHLSGPFRESLAALAPHRTGATPSDRWQVCCLSATPSDEPDAAHQRFGLEEPDREHPVLGRRLRADKPTRLTPVPVKGKEDARRATFAEALRDAALHQTGPGRAVALVVNRVDTALRLRHLLLEAGRKQGWAAVDPADPTAASTAPVRVALVTGRMRGLDRDRMGSWLSERLPPGRPRDPAGPGLVVVATQCIEAGADLDFDALVTECASLDALRQRAGRLDRAGTLGEAPIHILAREDALDPATPDPIYGAALAETWAWLQAQEDGLNLGISGTPAPHGRDATRLQAPAPLPPVLLPAHLDAWVQTSPRPQPQPEPAHFLHGIRRPTAEIQLCWRADLDGDLLARLGDAETGPAMAAAVLGAVPPRPGELVTVPLYALRQWLRGAEGADVGADLEGVEEAAPPDQRGPPEDPLVGLIWAGADHPSDPARLSDLRPGDLLVLPSRCRRPARRQLRPHPYRPGFGPGRSCGCGVRAWSPPAPAPRRTGRPGPPHHGAPSALARRNGGRDLPPRPAAKLAQRAGQRPVPI